MVIFGKALVFALEKTHQVGGKNQIFRWFFKGSVVEPYMGAVLYVSLILRRLEKRVSCGLNMLPIFHVLEI
jgi:hypothetical protein